MTLKNKIYFAGSLLVGVLRGEPDTLHLNEPAESGSMPRLTIEMPEEMPPKPPQNSPAPASRGGTPSLFAAIRSRNLERIDAAIVQGANLDARGPQGLTPLLAAIIVDRQGPVVKKLLDAGADVDLPDQRGLAPLYYSIWYNSSQDTDLLLRAHAKTGVIDPGGDPALIVAASFWRPQIINSFLAHGENPLVEGPNGRLIHYAVAHGEIPMISMLLAKGESIDRPTRKDGETPLMRAAVALSGAPMRAILEFKPNLDARDKAGWTALMHALSWDHRANADLLLAQGADATVTTSSGESAYLIAAQRGFSDLLDRLVAAGVSKVPLHLPPGAEPLRDLAPNKRFALAMAAVELYLDHLDLTDFHQGSVPERGAVQLLQRLGLKDAEQLRAKLDYSLKTGDRGASAEKMAAVSTLTDAEFEARLDAVSDDPTAVVALKEARRAVHRTSPHGLLAWDLCHHNFLAALGVRANYLREEEAWPKMIVAAKQLRASYQGWNEVAMDFFPGLEQKRSDGPRLEAIGALFLNKTDPQSAWTIVPFEMKFE